MRPPDNTPTTTNGVMGRALVLSCGALASDIRAVASGPGWDHVDFEYLPANYHTHPDRIVPAIEPILAARHADYDRILIGYGDCGTGGHLDALLDRYPNAQRIEGDHCYAFFAGLGRFDEWFTAEPGSFYLTDFLARHHEALVFGALGITDHPELRDMYFGNYRRVVYLAQNPTPDLTEAARSCAQRLNLDFVQSNVGRGLLESTLVRIRAAA